MGLANRELDGVRSGGDQRADGFFEILDALQKSAFVEKSVIDRDVEATVRFRIEQTIQAIGFHKCFPCGTTMLIFAPVNANENFGSGGARVHDPQHARPERRVTRFCNATSALPLAGGSQTRAPSRLVRIYATRRPLPLLCDFITQFARLYADPSSASRL